MDSMRRGRLALATDICQTRDTAHAMRELSEWGVLVSVLGARGCDCAHCASALRIAELAAAGYHARYLELMEVA